MQKIGLNGATGEPVKDITAKAQITGLDGTPKGVVGDGVPVTDTQVYRPPVRRNVVAPGSIPRYVRNVSNMVLPFKVGTGEEAVVRMLHPGEYIDLYKVFADFSDIMKNPDIRTYIEMGHLEVLTEEEFLRLVQLDRPRVAQKIDTNPMGIEARVGDNYVAAAPYSGEAQPISPAVRQRVEAVKKYLSTGDRNGGMTPSEFAVWIENNGLQPWEVDYVKKELGDNPLIESAIKKVGALR